MQSELAEMRSAKLIGQSPFDSRLIVSNGKRS